MDLAITKLSSRGQIVIPLEMRDNLVEGEKLILIKSGDKFILKKVNDFSKNFEEDLEFANRTEESLKRIDEGKGIKIDFDKFLEELESW
jgi:AbrB family looped-hinge helix DNA binding protein